MDYMKIGTRSVLYGAHAFWLHGWFVAAAWWKLFGFPTQLWLWVAFFVHDIGYWGKSNMDGEEGEQHPLTGANILYKFEWYIIKFLQHQGLSVRMTGRWGNEVLYHSRFWAQKNGMNPSDLCWADKYSISLIPWWLYLPMTVATGEVWEYVNKDKHHSDMATTHPSGKWGGRTWKDARHWFTDLQSHMRNVVEKRLHAPARA